MKQERIFAIVKKAGGGPEIQLIDKDHRAYGGMIDGKREVIPFPDMPGVCAVFDGEAAQNNKKPNCFVPEYNDLLCGTVIFAGMDFEAGYSSLNEEQAAKLEEYLKTNDAKGFAGNVAEKVATGYLPHTEEAYLYGLLCEVKTKYKAVKIKWLKSR